MPVINSLSDLKSISKTLKAEAKKREEEEKLAKEKELKALREANYFSHMMEEAGVVKMAQKNLADTKRPKPKPVVKSVEVEEPTSRKQLSDQADPNNFLSDENRLLHWRKSESPEIAKKLYRGFWAVQAWLDLHGYSTEEARVHVVDFLTESTRRGYRCVRIIHGVGYNSAAGKGKLREVVPRWLKQQSNVMAFVQSPVDKGDQGALLVLLEGKNKA